MLTGSLMGGFHDDFYKFTASSKAFVAILSSNLTQDGHYMLSPADPNSQDIEKQEEDLMTGNLRKPWAMIFYYKQILGISISYLLLCLLCALFSGLLIAFVLQFVLIELFWLRFSVSMNYSLFVLFQELLDEINWFSFSWYYLKVDLIDLLLGWAISTLLMVWYFHKSK